jgi:hypothetical protein
VSRLLGCTSAAGTYEPEAQSCDRGSVGASEGDDATEEAAADGRRGFVSGSARQIINMKHELVQLAGKIDWDWIDR